MFDAAFDLVVDVWMDDTFIGTVDTGSKRPVAAAYLRVAYTTPSRSAGCANAPSTLHASVSDGSGAMQGIFLRVDDGGWTYDGLSHAAIPIPEGETGPP